MSSIAVIDDDILGGVSSEVVEHLAEETDRGSDDGTISAAGEAVNQSNCTFGMPANNLSMDDHSTLKDLERICICPISQSLMIDPVIAMDGQTYERDQILAWFRKCADKRGPTSPITRRKFTNTTLIPNVSVRQTIQHLINSGSLACETVDEWRKAKTEIESHNANKARDEALARFPLGSEVLVWIHLKETRSHEPTESFHVDVHPIRDAPLVGFGTDSIFRALAIDRVLKAVEPCQAQKEAVRHFKAAFARGMPIPEAPLSPEVLLNEVFGGREDVTGIDENGHFKHTVNAVAHVLRRLSATDNGLPAHIRAEWEILDGALEQSRKNIALSKMRRGLANQKFQLKAYIESVDNHGQFTLRFPGLEKPTEARLPSAVADEQVQTDTHRSNTFIIKVASNFEKLCVSARVPPFIHRAGNWRPERNSDAPLLQDFRANDSRQFDEESSGRVTFRRARDFQRLRSSAQDLADSDGLEFRETFPYRQTFDEPERQSSEAIDPWDGFHAPRAPTRPRAYPQRGCINIRQMRPSQILQTGAA